jgi:hypothetical protein
VVLVEAQTTRPHVLFLEMEALIAMFMSTCNDPTFPPSHGSHRAAAVSAARAR